MADIESNIHLNIDTSQALANLKRLQAEISAFHTAMSKGGAQSAADAANLQRNLINSINAGGQFAAQMTTVKSTAESFTTALEKNKLSMGEYFRYSMAATKTFGRMFATEQATIEKVARERVKDLQTQYIKMGRDANGAMKAIAVRPLALDMDNLGTQTAMAAQKTQIFNQLIKQGSTQLLNFGKNTQWAGRQLMVGFSVPLGIAAAAAGREYAKLEEQAVRFKRVYGDAMTPAGEADKMVGQIQQLGKEFTNYGVAVEKTLGLAADAAAMGKTGADLIAQVAQANKLAVLGGVDQQKALETTTSLTSAFGTATDQLAGKINFLNAVENQTVTSIDDLTTAIPTAAPVIKQLGGNVEDLAFFLTAMREGGINASEGANALKSGLASIINPTQEAKNMLAGFNINLEAIVNANRGDVKGTILSLAQAFDTLDPTTRAQAIEQLFGKFQFARMSTLFQNVIKEGSQAQRVLELTKSSQEELAVLSEREMNRIKQSPLYQFQGAVERFQAALAPVGETFMKAVTPIIDFGTKILESFNNWGDGAKQFAIIATTVVAGIGPILLMAFGLISNGVANIIKMFQSVSNVFRGAGGGSKVLGEQLSYMSSQQIEAAAIASSLDQVHQTLIQTFTSEAGAINNLAGAYQTAIAAQSRFNLGTVTKGGARGARKMATGGMVGGTGNSDTELTLLTPGEFVIPAKQSKRFAPLLSQIVSGKIPGYQTGRVPESFSTYTNAVMFLDEDLNRLMGSSGADPAAVARSIQSRGAPSMSPFMYEVVRNVLGEGASASQIKKYIQQNPQIKNFAETLATNMATEVAKVPGNIRDEHFDSIAQTEARKLANSRKFKNVVGNAVEQTLSTVTGFEDTTVKRVSKTTGKVKGIGRRAMLRGVPLYEKQRSHYQDVYTMFGGEGSATGSLSHLTQKTNTSVSEMSKIKNLSVVATQALDRVKNKLIEVSSIGGTGRTTLPASASIREIRDAAGATPVPPSQGRNAVRRGGTTSILFTPAEQSRYDAADTATKRAMTIAKKKELQAVEEKISAIEEERQTTRKQVAENKKAGGYRRVSGKVAGGAMAASGILMGAQMLPGQAGQVASGLAGPVAAVTGILSVMSMIPGPAGAITAGLGTLGVAIGAMAIHVNNARDAAVKLNSELGTGNAAINKYAEFAGTATASQIMAKRRSEKTSQFNIQEGKTTFGESYLQSDSGKALLTSVKDAVKSNQMKDIQSLITNQMMTAVASGALSAPQARSIVAELTKQMGNEALGIRINGKLIELLGPNGEDLAKDPIAIRVKMMAESTETLNAQAQRMVSAQANLNKIENPIGMLSGGPNLLGLTLGGTFGSITSGKAGLGWDTSTAIWEKMGNVASTAGAMSQTVANVVQQQQQMLDSLDLEYEKRIAIAKAAGDLNKVTQLQIQLETGKSDIIEQGKKSIDSYLKAYKNSTDSFGFAQGEFGKSLDTAIENAYKNDAMMQAQAVAARDALVSSARGLYGMNSEQEVRLKLSLVSTDVAPGDMLNILTTFSKDQGTMDAFINIGINAGTATQGEAARLVNMFVDKDGNPKKDVQSNFLMQVEAKSNDPEAVQQYIDAMSLISQTSTVTGEVTMEYYVKNPEKLTEIKNSMDIVKEQAKAGPIPITFLENVLENTPGAFEALQADQAYFNSLPPEQQVTYIQTLMTVYKTIGTPEFDTGFNAWLASTGKKQKSGKAYKYNTANGLGKQEAKYVQQYVDYQAQRVTEASRAALADTGGGMEAPATGGGGGGGGGRTSSVLDDLLQKLRKVQIATLALTDGWAGARQALDNLFPAGGSNSPFQGIEQQMRRLGAKENLIQLIAGMDPEEFQKRKNELFTFDGAGNITGFRESLLSLGAALRSISFGEFQSAQQKNINGLKDQNTAIGKLVANGFSLADAFEMVKDSAFASAVAQETNNNIIKQATENYKEATAQAKIYAAAQSAVTANLDTATSQSILGFVQANAGNLSNAVIEEMLKNKDFATLMMSPTLSPEQQTALDQWISNIENSATLQLNLDLTNITGMEKVFSDGFNKAMDAFSAQEKKIELDFEIKKDPFQKVVETANNLINDIQNRPGGLDDLQAELERIGYKEEDINKAYQTRIDALQQVRKANEAITQQKKAELTIADALTQGDIAAAAKAVEDARSQQAQAAMQTQEDLLNRQKQIEIDALTANMGLTREQIETRIRALKQQILTIEETMLEPAQYQLTLLDRQEKRQKESLTVLGMTRREWETLKNRIDVAKTSSDEYTRAMEAARDVVGKILEYWKEIEKPKTTIHTTIERVVYEGSGGAGNIGASGDSGQGGPSGPGNVSGPSPTPSTPTPAQVASSILTSVSGKTATQWLSIFNSEKAAYLKMKGQPSPRGAAAGPWSRSMAAHKTAANDALRNYYKINDSRPGSIHNIAYLSKGGYINKFAKGTDIIPAMLTPGEFVMTKPAYDKYGSSMMNSINNGTFEAGSVYNEYNINVNVKSDANPDEIAKAVRMRLEQVNAQRIRSNKF